MKKICYKATFKYKYPIVKGNFEDYVCFDDNELQIEDVDIKAVEWAEQRASEGAYFDNAGYIPMTLESVFQVDGEKEGSPIIRRVRIERTCKSLQSSAIATTERTKESVKVEDERNPYNPGSGYWCSKGLEPEYEYCANCPFKRSPIGCEYRHKFHEDAVRWCDMSRMASGLRPISGNFDLMRENFGKKELAERKKEQEERMAQSEIYLSEQMKLEAMRRHSLQNLNNMTLEMALGGIGVCLLLGFPMAYFGQLFQIFTEFIFNMLGTFLESGPHPENLFESYGDNFFYADFANRYVYWVSLMVAVWSWSGYDSRFEAGKIDHFMRVVFTTVFLIVALTNFNLFISSILGPLFVIFGLLITARR